MRNLLKLLGSKKRFEFKGTFERYGTESGDYYCKNTITLKNISHNNGIVASHLWFYETKRFLKLGELKQGDLIEFTGRVKKYKKGKKKNKSDYKIAYPTNIKKLN